MVRGGLTTGGCRHCSSQPSHNGVRSGIKYESHRVNDNGDELEVRYERFGVRDDSGDRTRTISWILNTNHQWLNHQWSNLRVPYRGHRSSQPSHNGVRSGIEYESHRVNDNGDELEVRYERFGLRDDSGIVQGPYREFLTPTLALT
jgi:hypothetical protein